MTLLSRPGARFTLWRTGAALGFAIASASAAAGQREEAADQLRVEALDVAAGQKALLATDLDGDGFLDLVVAAQDSGRVLVLRGDGAGGFAPPAAFPAGDNPAWLASADLDGDGRADLAVANHERRSLTLLLSEGSDGLHLTEAAPLTLATEPHSHMVAAADLDLDGEPDLIVDSRDRDGVHVLKGLGGGAFDAPGVGVDAAGAPYLGFALGDINGDGRLDLATPNADDVSILMNRSAGAISFELTQSLPVADPFSVALADFDGDGRAELVAASEGRSPGVQVFRQSDAGAFALQGSFAMAQGAKSIAIGDVDGDGLEDAVIICWSAELLLLRGGTEAVAAAALPLAGVSAPWGVATGDFDGDGKDEIAVADAESARINVYFHTGG